MSKTYYTLAVRDADNDLGRWSAEFGAYEKKDVMDERDNLRAQGHRAKDLMIITTGDMQREIDAGITALNFPQGHDARGQRIPLKVVEPVSDAQAAYDAEWGTENGGLVDRHMEER